MTTANSTYGAAMDSHSSLRPPQLWPALIVLLAALAAPRIALAQPTAQGAFQTSDRCTACHNSMIAPDGMDVSIAFDWRSSMMANSARDPYWQAAVRREVMDHPRDQQAIEDKCATCHMGMARWTSTQQGGFGAVLTNLPSARPAATPNALLAADGVGCTLCHQIRSDNFGQPSSLSGGFIVAPWQQGAQREIFGPFEVDRGRTGVMSSGTSGFAPAESKHVQSSDLCGGCHTLYTHPHDEQGNPLGELPEQMPYVEWQHSSYSPSRGCTSCHMPLVDRPTPITSVLPKDRQALSRHVFRGGNFFMPRMLNRYRMEQGVVALGPELETTAARSAEHLATASASLTIRDVAHDEGRLEFVATIANRAGHKLPTAYPSRRAWLHTTVRDATGKVLFESGALRRDGGIVGNDNDEDGSRFEPHHPIVDDAAKVPIFESIMVDQHDRVTTGLMSGVRYIKDNRILPTGFDKSTAHRDVAVHGGALTDGAFRAGAASVRYAVTVGSAPRPLEVTVALRYQPIGFRWARNLGAIRSMETDRFVRYFDSMAEGSAATLADARTRVP